MSGAGAQARSRNPAMPNFCLRVQSSAPTMDEIAWSHASPRAPRPGRAVMRLDPQINCGAGNFGGLDGGGTSTKSTGHVSEQCPQKQSAVDDFSGERRQTSGCGDVV